MVELMYTEVERLPYDSLIISGGIETCQIDSL